MASPAPGVVQEQLKRLLAHPLFSLSKRYPALLAYIVEQKLLGHAGDLKERTIGIEVFGREPDYDVNADPVVRTSAAEVRKRLIQYYYDTAHTGELIIELYAGSYIPQFREPLAHVAEEASHAESPLIEEGHARDAAAAVPAALEIRPAILVEEEHASSYTRWKVWTIGAVCLLTTLVGGVALGRYERAHVSSSYSSFWAPVTSSSGPVTYCLGSIANNSELQKDQPEDESSSSGILHVSDVIALARTIMPLVAGKKPYRVLSARSTTFSQLREGPDVLIGAFDNVWTMRITSGFRYGFEMRNGVALIADRKNPSQVWTLQWEVPLRKPSADYAIVARIHDRLTGQPVIVVGGILGEGTAAASELVSDPAYLDAVLKNLPRNWQDHNLEVVIKTQVIGGHPGPPEVLATDIW